MANRLKQEKSPYLMQHGENPVDWYPWCEEAFQKADKAPETNTPSKAKKGKGSYQRHEKHKKDLREAD